jgi:catalase
MAKNKRFATVIGEGGETHQRMAKGDSHSAEGHLTTNQRIRVSDNQNSLRSGARGPTLLEDFVLREKIFHFDHERIPERIVHARSTLRWKDVPRGTMDEVSSLVRLHLPFM